MGIRRWWADQKAAFNLAAEERRRRNLRDQFAGQALMGMLANHSPKSTSRALAEDAYMLADAMIEAREE
jgi:hypothetical protein